jgi:hypothetical protein
MPRNKRDLEKIEAIADRSETMTPFPRELIEDIQRTISDAWSKAKENPKVRNDAEGLQILRGLIKMETNPIKRELHERIFGIADRMTHEKPLSVSDNASQSEQANEPLPLHERIKFLRERLN